MSELPPDEAFVAAAGAHSGSPKAAANEACGAVRCCAGEMAPGKSERIRRGMDDYRSRSILSISSTGAVDDQH
jgi:hypothetical protein